MKYFMICMLIIVTGCSDQQSEKSLEGIYVGYSETEFGKTDDTLIVSEPNSTGKVIQIERHSGVVKMLDGKEFPKELEIVTWTLEYDPVKQTLLELKDGKILIWNDKNKTLKLGDRIFRQISANKN